MISAYAHQFSRLLWIRASADGDACHASPFPAPRTMASLAPAQQFLTPTHHPRGRKPTGLWE
eukprot:614293-Pleurochrysis_carterae.AAC.1